MWNTLSRNGAISLKVVGIWLIFLEEAKYGSECCEPVVNPQLHSKALQMSGMSLVTGLLSDKEIKRWKDEVILNQNVKEIGKGRYHRSILTEKGESSQAIVKEMRDSVCARMKPLLDSFFGSQKYFLSEVQLLRTLPGCASQFYHVDNEVRGVTCICSLTLGGVSQQLGPTRLLRGSHMLNSEWGQLRILREIGSIWSKEYNIVNATLAQEGDAVLFDARTLHRGLANMNESQEHLMLVLRWDVLGHGPAVNPISTTLYSILGSMIEYWIGY
jgi:hypothetical protein